MMRYLLALLCPPLAILLCGRLFLFLISIPLCIFYFPSALIALLVASDYYSDRRFDRHFSAALKVERSYLKIWKSHMKVVNAGIKEQNKMIRIERKRMEAEDNAAKYQARAALPPKEPLITWQGVKSGTVMIGEMAVLAKDQGVNAYRNLPEWAQPITWGLAAGTPLSIGFILLMVLKK